MTDEQPWYDDWGTCSGRVQGKCYLPGGCPHFALTDGDMEGGYTRWLQKRREGEMSSLREVFFAGAHWGQFVARNKIDGKHAEESRP